jgi:hypothetical protein
VIEFDLIAALGAMEEASGGICKLQADRHPDGRLRLILNWKEREHPHRAAQNVTLIPIDGDDTTELNHWFAQGIEEISRWRETNEVRK